MYKCFLLVLLCFLPLPAHALTVTDDLGHELVLDAPAQRVLALYGAFNEIALSLEAGDRLVARTAADGDLPELAALPVIGTHMRPNPELIVASQPDVILQLAGRQEAQTQTEALRSLGFHVLTFTMESFEDIFRVTGKLGVLLGRRTQAGYLVSDWKARLAALRTDPDRHTTVRVFYEARYQNLLAAGSRGIIQDVITAAGGVNVVREPKKLVSCNEEALIRADPDVYFIQRGPMNPDAPPPDARPGEAFLVPVQYAP